MGDMISGAAVAVGNVFQGTEPLLEGTALESAGIEVDPRNQRLKRLQAVRLRGCGAPHRPPPLPREH